ncbi:class I SAM-dependent methyltransferase [Streptomyces sp. AB3(2024)]|uniref:class I SAM-dependent methyltransferase n=1 Tax=Streptomyces sp. AB3(2024) TaxID=3317321 RepID=UPI0035A37962
MSCDTSSLLPAGELTVLSTAHPLPCDSHPKDHAMSRPASPPHAPGTIRRNPGLWDLNMVAAHGPVTAAEQLFVAEHMVTERAGRTAVEVGCGTGRFAHWLHHAHGYHVTGLDLSPHNLGLARLRGQGTGLSHAAHDAETASAPPSPRCGNGSTGCGSPTPTTCGASSAISRPSAC